MYHGDATRFQHADRVNPTISGDDGGIFQSPLVFSGIFLFSVLLEDVILNFVCRNFAAELE
jgi:hypothetical protein